MIQVPSSGVTAVGKDEVQHVAAALELVAGDADVGEEDGDGAEDAGGLVIACFEEVGQRELRKAAGARGDEVDEEQTEPATGRQPESGESVPVGIFSAGKERSRADPRGEQREDQHHGGERAAGDQVVGLGLHPQGAIDGHRQQRGGNHGQDNDIEKGHRRRSSKQLNRF